MPMEACRKSADPLWCSSIGEASLTKQGPGVEIQPSNHPLPSTGWPLYVQMEGESRMFFLLQPGSFQIFPNLPQKVSCWSHPSFFYSGVPLVKLSLGLTGYLLVLLSWVKDGPDGPKVPLQIHCLKFPIPSNLELFMFKPDLISRTNSSIPGPQNLTFCSEKNQRMNLAILDTWSQTDVRLILNAAT